MRPGDAIPCYSRKRPPLAELVLSTLLAVVSCRNKSTELGGLGHSTVHAEEEGEATDDVLAASPSLVRPATAVPLEPPPLPPDALVTPVLDVMTAPPPTAMSLDSGLPRAPP